VELIESAILVGGRLGYKVPAPYKRGSYLLFPTSVSFSTSWHVTFLIQNVPSSYPYNFLYLLFFSLLRAKPYSAPTILLVYALI